MKKILIEIAVILVICVASAFAKEPLGVHVELWSNLFWHNVISGVTGGLIVYSMIRIREK